MKDNRLDKMHRMAQCLNKTGTIDQLTMCKIDILTTEAKLADFSAEQIREIRTQEGISQGVLATVLNMSSESVKKWEQGKSKPYGAALRLLSLIKRNGIEAVI